MSNRLVFAVSVLVLVLILVGSLMPNTAFASKRVALVIGNSNYNTSPLKNPVNDAKDIASVLKKLDFKVILETDANKRKMVYVIDRFARELKHADVGLFYFAGHGMQINGNNYLIPVSASVSSESDVELEAVDARRIIGKMREGDNKLNMVILDACRNNPFQRSFRSAQQGLAQMNAPIGTIIAYATGIGSVAADGKGRNGTFTKHLLNAFVQPGLDIQDIFNEAGLNVMEETEQKQVPWVSNTPIPKYFLAGGNPLDFYSDAPGQLLAEPTTCILKVTSVPAGADVRVEGKVAGQTPVQLGNMTPGTVRVSVSKTGYHTDEKRATLKVGRRTVVNFDLRQEQKNGWLTVQTSPNNARVRILNITPAYNQGMKLAAGRYHIEVSSSGYESEKRWVEIEPGDDITVDFSLEKKATVLSRSFSDLITNMDFAKIDGGCFQMGQTGSEKRQLIQERGEEKYNKYYKDELPRHEVCVDGFYMGKYEVTVGQWRKFIKDTTYRTDAEKDTNKDGCKVYKEKWGWQDGYYWDNVGFSQSSSQPVACVSHNDVQEFVSWLNRKSSRHYRLPTEAEWEYAARGGTTMVRYWGDASGSNACKYANVGDKAHGWGNDFPCDDGYDWSSPVGKFKPNKFGLYDMLGNVWEWTGDWFDKSYYSKSSRNNPTGPASGVNRVLRGGCWYNYPANVRSALRNGNKPWNRSSGIGFRLVSPFPGQ